MLWVSLLMLLLCIWVARPVVGGGVYHFWGSLALGQEKTPAPFRSAGVSWLRVYELLPTV